MTRLAPDEAGIALWGLFLVSWYAAMLWIAPMVRRTSAASRLGDFLIYAVAFGLLFSHRIDAGPGSFGGVSPSLWVTPWPLGDLLLVAEAAAFAFAWWARLHLGPLWSGMITLREGHRVVDTGPYALVRHPIYTGFLGAGWAYALIVGTPQALLGAALLTAQMAWKAKREEAFLRRELGAEAYDAYAARTPMLIPVGRRSG